MPRRVITNAAAPRVYEIFPDLRQQAIATAVIGDQDITQNLILASLSGPVFAANQVRRYANSPNYFYSAPTVTSSVDSRDRQGAWLEFIEAQNPLPSDEFYDLINDVTRLQGERGDTELTGRFALQNNPIVDPDTLSRFAQEGDDAVVYKNTAGGEVEHLRTPNPILGSNRHYAVVDVYRDGFRNVQDILLRTEYYIYDESQNTAIGLHVDENASQFALEDEMHPFIPIRLNGVDYESDGSGLEGERSIAGMCRRLKLNPADLVDAIRETQDPDGNVVEDTIDDVYVGFGISMNAIKAIDIDPDDPDTLIEEPDEAAIAGLLETFIFLDENNPGTEVQFNDTGLNQSIEFNSNDVGGLDSILRYNYIKVERKVGIVDYTVDFTPGVTTRYGFSDNNYVFTKPLTGPDEGFYDEITVNGLNQSHFVVIDEEDTIREVVLSDGDEEALVIPLMKSVIRRVSPRLRDDLVFGSIRLMIYTVQVINLSWYETGLFRAVITIAAIALAVYSGGGTLAALSAATSITAVALILIKALVVLLLTNYAVQFLIEEVGGTLGVILAVALSLFVGGGQLDFSTLASAISTTWYPLFTAVVRVYTQVQTNQLEAIKDEQAEFNEGYEERMRELKEARESLNFGTKIDFLDVLEYRSLPNTNVNESSQAFYDRTSTTVDLGAVNSSLVDNYYDVQLALPVVDSYLPDDRHNNF